MNRRRLLAGIGALTAGTMPLWLQEAWGAAGAVPGLLTAQSSARAAGRPLLIIVAPADRSWERTERWGPLLNYADERVMARLGQCEAVCADPQAVEEVFSVTGAPWLWLVPPGGAPVAADIDPVVEPPPVDPLLDAKAKLSEWQAINAELAGLSPGCMTAASRAETAGTLHEIGALLADRDTSMLAEASGALEEIYARLEAAITCAGVPASGLAIRLEAASSITIDPDPGVTQQIRLINLYIDALSAAVERAVGAALGPLPADIAPLQERGVALYRAKAPVNSRWGHDSGCGVSYEQPDGSLKAEQPGIRCGMGHVPARAARFLEYYVG